ncbi:MmgE/PrpD family protein [Yunchengibacter salinarum]|uniref:MmgE/PrpD family protein n=1 Tax=Yunchengibacter salinarum TaxID=3133399 RepID=UPI0035B63DD1
MSETPTPVEAYGRWVAETDGDWGEDALHSAHRQFIDTLAVMVPGAAEPVTHKAMALARQWGSGPVRAVGFADTLSAPMAAMVNGTAGHALDFDDNFDPPKGHSSTVLVPAILAVADLEGLSGAACLDAYIAGLQIQGRVGQALNPYHRDRGWHATATTGAVGAAAAVARLLKLDGEAAGRAISISTSMAAGFMSQFGTMTKPLHAGLAAKAGVMAGYFAREGITAGRHTLDGRTGMNTLMVGPDLKTLRARLENPDHGHSLRFEMDHIGDPLLITEHAFRVKRFPNCGAAHRAMDGVLDLITQQRLGADDIAEVHVHAPRVHFNNLMYTAPETGLGAKFSMEYALACLIATGKCTLADFTDEAVRRPDVRALFDRIHRHPVDALEGHCPTEVVVLLKDGVELTSTVTMPRGSKPAPFSDAEYWQKFESCTAPHMTETDRAALAAALKGLRRADSIDDLAASYGRALDTGDRA